MLLRIYTRKSLLKKWYADVAIKNETEGNIMIHLLILNGRADNIDWRIIYGEDLEGKVQENELCSAVSY